MRRTGRVNSKIANAPSIALGTGDSSVRREYVEETFQLGANLIINLEVRTKSRRFIHPFPWFSPGKQQKEAQRPRIPPEIGEPKKKIVVKDLYGPSACGISRGRCFEITSSSSSRYLERNVATAGLLRPAHEAPGANLEPRFFPFILRSDLP